MHVYTYSIHSLDVLRLILSYFYLICAVPFVIIGSVKGGGGGGSTSLSPFRRNTGECVSMLVCECECVCMCIVQQ